MSLVRSSLLCAAALFAACDNKITSTLDADLQKRVDTVRNCFPGLYAKAQGLLDLANTWRMNASTSIPDPAGLVHSQQGDGSILATYTFGGSTLTLTMTIRFYSAAGAQQNINLSGATTLADQIDLAATTLRNLPGAPPFLVGAWTLAGAGISGSGALTGIIGGSTNGNELQELRTTTATPVGGPPPNADSTITDNGPPVCTLTFNTMSLVTDSFPTQAYPIGTITISIAGPEATVTATITFNDTAVAKIVVSGISGRFDFDVNTKTLTYVP